jgi:hypothetical protein
MGRMDTFTPAPPAAVTRVLATFDRHQLEGFIAVALDLLDLADGEPDDEEDDPPEAGGDERDLSWHEWHTRGRRKGTSAGYEMADIGGKHGIPSTMPTEDDEDDDPAEEDDPSGECSEDEISCGPGNWGHWNWREAGPGCQISDEGIADMGGFYD